MVSEAMRRFRERAKERQGGFENDHSVFPFWNLPFDGSATFRFIPFEDELSGNFYTEKKIIKMTFIDPNDESKLVLFDAPCYEMYSKDKKCPILQPVRDLYGEAKGLKNSGDTQEAERLEKIAGAHWIKPIFYYQGFVIKAGMNESDVPGNPIRVFPMLKQIHQVILGRLVSEEEDAFDRLPTGEFSIEDINNLLTEGAIPEDEVEEVLRSLEGVNFILKKTKQGEYANYQTSTWGNGYTSLSEDQIEALNTHGLHDLRERLPDQPTDDQYEIMTEMVNVSIRRLLGDDEGYWDPAWEEAGLKPKKAKGDGKGGDKPAARRGGNVGSKLKAQLSKKGSSGSADASAVTSNVMDKVKRKGAKAADADDAEPKKASPAKSDLAARIKSSLKKDGGAA